MAKTKTSTGPTVHMTKGTTDKDGKVTPHPERKGARAAYVTRLAEFDGKPLAELKASCEATPPSVPKSGKPEAFSGWLAWFKREGYVLIKD